MTFRVVDEVPVDPSTGRVYAEGWQSWSPAAWYPVGSRGLAPEAGWQHTMRFRPGTPVAAEGVQAEGLLVVDPGSGEPARCYGATDAHVVPTVRAKWHDGHVVVVADGEESCLETTQSPAGGMAALAAYADTFATRAGAPALAAPPTVWCSWYRYFEDVTAADIEENLAAFDTHDLAVDVVQIDDGWSPGLGEGLSPAPGFDLSRAVGAIQDAGRRVGIWLAPFAVGRDTTLATEHPDWLVGDAGHNWRQDLGALDLTHPAVRDLLAGHVTRLVELGATYLKLDFLYAGAVPAVRHDDVSGSEAYRSGLHLIREAAGPDVFLLGCGAPLLPSVGLVDAMRVSPDTFHEGGEDGSAGLRGLMPLAARAWQQGRFWVNDPDCLVARPSYALREEWAGHTLTYGGLRSCSDRVSDLDEWGLATTRRSLESGGRAEPFALEVTAQGATLAAAEMVERLVPGEPA